MICPDCRNTGYRTVEVPVFCDGGYSDVDQIEERCRCNPAPTDEDAPDDADAPDWSAVEDYATYLASQGGEFPDWQDVPELWDQQYPEIDYDRAA